MDLGTQGLQLSPRWGELWDPEQGEDPCHGHQPPFTYSTALNPPSNLVSNMTFIPISQMRTGRLREAVSCSGQCGLYVAKLKEVTFLCQEGRLSRWRELSEGFRERNPGVRVTVSFVGLQPFA